MPEVIGLKKLGEGEGVLSHGGFGPLTMSHKGNLTFQTLQYELRRVFEFMRVNPKSVMTIILEDYADPTVTAVEIEAVAKDFKGDVALFCPQDLEKLNGAWPTPGAMRQENKRLVVFTLNGAQTASTFHQFDHCFENSCGTSDEDELCRQREESAASQAQGRQLVVFNHFPGAGSGSGVTGLVSVLESQVRYTTADQISTMAKQAGFAGGRMFNGYWADRVIDCVTSLDENQEFTIFDLVNEFNARESPLVITDTGYRFTSFSAKGEDKDIYLANFSGSYARAGSVAVRHRLQSVKGRPHLEVYDGDLVYLRTTALGADDNVYLNAENDRNLWYSPNHAGDEKWAVERVDTSLKGPIKTGERVRFKSERQTKDAGDARYLSRESDLYPATRALNNTDEENLGIEWIIGK